VTLGRAAGFRALGDALLLLMLVGCGGAAVPSGSASQQAGVVRATSGGETPTAVAKASGSAVASAAASAEPVVPASVAPSAAAAPPLRIGLLAPFSGQAAAFGQEMLKAAQMALDEANSAGGAGGKRLAIDQADDKSDSSSASAAAQKLAADGVAAVIGPATSASAMAAESALNEAKLPSITPAANDPRITDARLPFLFRATGRWDQEAPLLVDYLAKQPVTAKIALVADKSPYGQILDGAMNQALAKASLSPVADETVDSGTKDFRPLAARLKQKAPGAVFYGGFAGDGAALAKSLRAAGSQAVLVMGDAAEDQSLITSGGDAVEGLVLAYPPDAKQTPSAAGLLDTYRQRYGTAASLYALSTYDSTRLLLDALRRAGSTEPDAVRQAIASTRDFTGAYWGPMSFDAKGDLQAKTYVLWTVRDGKFVTMSSQ